MRSLLFEIKIPWTELAIPIRSYGVLAAVGFLFGLWVMLRLAEKSGTKKELAYDVWFGAFVGGWAGARVWYVVQYWGEQFAENPWSVFAITSGGLVWFGGVIGAFIAVAVVARMRGAALLRVLDLAAPPAALGLAFGRIGCFLNGCCYGRITDVAWAVRFPQGSPAFHHHVELGAIGAGDAWSAAMHPTQLYASLWALALFGVLTWYTFRRRATGQVFALLLLLYSPMRIFFEWLRDDVPAAALGMTPAQITSILMFVAGVALFAAAGRRARARDRGE